ncbi:MAG: 2-C-methyl-D-erythritol 4-phosphate cytidylyltransferase [Ammonifex sp.]|nr:MAG: 2-C-methyl-D-erythritol 4-phosphate cytidylyltransferase [Ammonifex sp.]
MVEVGAVIVAAGRSVRMGGGSKKQYRFLGGLPVVSRTLTIFEKEAAVASVVLVVPPGDEDYCRKEIVAPAGCRKVAAVVAGGEHRQDSVWAGLQCLPGPPDIVIVHDAVRPLVDPEIVKEAIDAAVSYGAVVVGVPAKDTVKVVDASGLVVETLPRDRLYLAQTPQVFRFDILFEAHRRAREEGFYGSDDAVLVERRGLPVQMVHGGYENIKITTPEDFTVAAALAGESTPLRVGYGFDVHRLVTDRPLILGGVTIPWEKGLEGHSDADVLCHALMDALLGAAGAGDIGRHFPPTDEAFRGISSLTLLAEVRKIVNGRGFGVVNADAVVVAQRPKIAPYADRMVANLAAVLELPASRINIKATTTEGLGYAGRGEGIAAYAVALLHRT